jgi:hypothetical protein
MKLRRRLLGLAVVLFLTAAGGGVRAQENTSDRTKEDEVGGAASRRAVSAQAAALQVEPATKMQELASLNVQYVGVDRAHFDAVLEGTARLQKALSQVPTMPAPQAPAVLHASAESEALFLRAMENGEIAPRRPTARSRGWPARSRA